MPALLVVISLAGVAMLAAGCSTSKAEERGRQLYAERGCAVCHGPAGRGDGPSAKRLNLPPRDFANVRASRSACRTCAAVPSCSSSATPRVPTCVR